MEDDDSDSGNANAFSEESTGVSQDPQTELTVEVPSTYTVSRHQLGVSAGNVNRWLKRLRINAVVTEIA